jgi:hypothetical protein
MSNQDKKIKNFREFYDDEDDRPNRKKQIKEYKKDRLKVKQRLKNFDPNNFAEDDLDDLYE